MGALREGAGLGDSTICHPERSPEGAESKDPEGSSCAYAVRGFLTRMPGGFG